MKKLLTGMSFLLIVSAAALAQEKKLNSAPQRFRTFFATFKRAVERSDKTAVASMTRFPFSYGYDAGDEGTYSKTAFIRNFRKIFSKGDDFFTNRNPRFGRDDDGTYYISTEDAAHLGFVSSLQSRGLLFVNFTTTENGEMFAVSVPGGASEAVTRCVRDATANLRFLPDPRAETFTEEYTP